MDKPIKPKFTATVHRAATDREAASTFSVQVVGRVAWCLLSLIQAGERGCTPINRPAPRWSDYAFRLRGLGVNVETINETHGGPYAGGHARYVLRDNVTVGGGNLADFLASPEGRREFPHFALKVAA